MRVSEFEPAATFLLVEVLPKERRKGGIELPDQVEPDDIVETRLIKGRLGFKHLLIPRWAGHKYEFEDAEGREYRIVMSHEVLGGTVGA